MLTAPKNRGATIGYAKIGLDDKRTITEGNTFIGPIRVLPRQNKTTRAPSRPVPGSILLLIGGNAAHHIKLAFGQIATYCHA